MAGKPPFEMPEGDYAGDVTSQEAWDVLASDPESVLVDVRTSVEWQLIGKPDLSSIHKEPVYLQWVTMEGMNPNFIDELKVALAQRDVAPNTPVFFICQSGGRSKMSAMQCTAAGYKRCYNIAEGFEGELDEHKHRNSISGWKVAKLPWTQS
jgi:rhodanese-related sulfurtransferase